MKIILHNPSHNGDQLHTLGIVKRLIDDNVDKQFTIVPACSMYLFHDMLSDRVTLENHPVLWENNMNIFNNKNFISENYNVLWNYHEGDIYINIWKLLVQNNNNCISLVNRPLFIKNMLQEINNATGIYINFNCDNYKELIPVLPAIDIQFVQDKIASYNKKVIFFYNQNSYCGAESAYPTYFNDTILQTLITTYGEDCLIITSKPSTISHENVINVESEFGIYPQHDGKNLIINSYIANLCEEVYFKNNGGSLFILNKMNISNDKTKYYFYGTYDFYNVISNEYGLLCSYKKF